MDRKPKILISGGGTGGHIFPALSIADACRRRFDAEILFVGAEGRMEMERVPKAGYEIKGLPVAGFNRKNLLKNFSVLLKLRRSMKMARKIIRDFQPDIAVGVGGYASGPTLKVAQKSGIPTLLQEQNSYAGVTNKMLAKGSRKICVAYPGMERFFPAGKIVETGNPVRKALTDSSVNTADGRKAFGLDASTPTLLAVGGSLGALSINEAMERGIDKLEDAGIQVIWQTGNGFASRAAKAVEGRKGIVTMPFIPDMASAYAAADLVISRAGAGTISELELLGKPCILVPSPNVAEDHQTKNARALEQNGAAILIKDDVCREKLADTAIELLKQPEKLAAMAKAVKEMAYPESDERIADEIAGILGM